MVVLSLLWVRFWWWNASVLNVKVIGLSSLCVVEFVYNFSLQYAYALYEVCDLPKTRYPIDFLETGARRNAV